MSNTTVYKDLIAFHPGSYVIEIIEDLNITQKEFAHRLGTTPKTISKIVNGEAPISDDIAFKLSKLTGVSTKTWMNLQNAYNLKVLEIKESKEMDESKICRQIDFNYFKKHKLVEPGIYNEKQKIEKLRTVLKVADLTLLDTFNYSVSYRNTKEFEKKSILNSNIMLELATSFARKGTENKFDKDKLKAAIPTIRKMTTTDPEVFYNELKSLLLDCGIVLVGLPALKNANLQGAIKKFKNESVLLLITDRNKNSDIFWFSLFHELGHALKEEFYTDSDDNDKYKEREKAADEFAMDTLIPKSSYLEFLNKNDFSKSSVQSFSKEIEIHPSIVIGRLQNDKLLNYNQLSDLKVRYDFCLSI